MSKSLEKEYKEHIQMETPDLWGRIEKELSEREQKAETKGVQQSEEKTPIEKKSASETETKVRRGKFRKWATYGSLAAAAVVAVVVLPFLSGGMKAEDATADMCAVEATGGTVAKENTALTAEDAVNMEMVAEAADEAGMSDSMEAGDAAEAECVEGEYAEEGVAKGVAEGATESVTAGESGLTGTVVVTIEVTERLVSEDGIVVYTGVTESGEVYSFTLVEEIVTEEEIEELLEGERYRVELMKKGEMFEAVRVWD